MFVLVSEVHAWPIFASDRTVAVAELSTVARQNDVNGVTSNCLGTKIRFIMQAMQTLRKFRLKVKWMGQFPERPLSNCVLHPEVLLFIRHGSKLHIGLYSLPFVNFSSFQSPIKRKNNFKTNIGRRQTEALSSVM